METFRTPQRLVGLIKGEPGIGHLLDLAGKVVLANRPRAAACVFYRRAAEKLAGPAACRQELRDSAVFKLC
jgi:hypothetical protein